MTKQHLEQALETANRYRAIPESQRPVYKMEAVALLDEVERMRAALTISRGQWIHSVNARQCLEALGESPVEPSKNPRPAAAALATGSIDQAAPTAILPQPVAWRSIDGFGCWHFTAKKPDPEYVTIWAPLYAAPSEKSSDYPQITVVRTPGTGESV